MPSARKAGVPPEVLQEWEADFRKKKAEQKKSGGKKLPSGSVQYTHDGVTYTAKWADQGKGTINFPEAAYEASVEGSRSRRGERQKIKLGEAEQLMQQYRYEDAKMLSEYMGQQIDVEHGIPIAKGGFSNDPNNLGFATRETNLAKGDKLGGSEYNRALGEHKYLSELANQLRAERGSIKFATDRFARGLTRTLLPSAGGAAVSVMLGAEDLQAREQLAEQDPSFLNVLQRDLARTEMASDIAGAVPSPISPATEITGLAAGGGNLIIDAARDPIGALKAVGGGIRYMANEYILGVPN
jgi:hypothetical protein